MRPREYDDNDLRIAVHNLHYDMLRSCYLPSYGSYPLYGGKGITVCMEWFDFKTFYQWAIDSGYQKGLIIQRVDENAEFSPLNCVLDSKKGRKKNFRKPKYVEYKGKRKALIAWANEYGIKKETLNKRLSMGWSMHNALTTPVRTYSGAVRDDEMIEWEE